MKWEVGDYVKCIEQHPETRIFGTFICDGDVLTILGTRDAGLLPSGPVPHEILLKVPANNLHYDTMWFPPYRFELVKKKV